MHSAVTAARQKSFATVIRCNLSTCTHPARMHACWKEPGSLRMSMQVRGPHSSRGLTRWGLTAQAGWTAAHAPASGEHKGDLCQPQRPKVHPAQLRIPHVRRRPLARHKHLHARMHAPVKYAVHKMVVWSCSLLRKGAIKGSLTSSFSALPVLLWCRLCECFLRAQQHCWPY
jgi:hypothetical protein